MIGNRDRKLDALKGFAMILVVMGHIIAFSNSGDLSKNFLFNFIYSFHMPLFFFISGYLVFGRYGPTPGKWIYRKFRQLIVPYILFTIFYFYILFGRPMFELSPAGVISTLFRFSVPDSAWFLPVLFESLILLALCIEGEKIAGTCSFAIFFLIFSISVPLIGLDSNPVLHQIVVYTPYVLAGYLACRYRGMISEKSNTIAITGSIVFLILFFFKFYVSLPVINSSLFYLYYSYIMALGGIILSWFVIRSIINYRITTAFIVCGIFSLEIYLVHLVLINYFTFQHWPLWIGSGILAAVSGTIILTGLSLIFSLILAYNEKISMILFGRWSWKYLASLGIDLPR